MKHASAAPADRLARSVALALLAASSFAFVTVATTARADDATPACVAAYESGQVLRKAGKLTAARERLLTCAQASCSPVLRTQCAQWITELEGQTPTVVLIARGAEGEDLVAAQVSLDGQEIAPHLDGKAIPLDPGPHTFRFTVAGAPPHEEAVVISQGEHDRQIVADFRPATSARATRPAPMPLAVPILSGVAAGGFATFAVAGLLGLSEKNALDARQCKPTCPQADVDAAHTKFIVADIGLGVGAASLALAAILFLSKGEVRADDRAPAIAVTAGPLRGGAALGMTASF